MVNIRFKNILILLIAFVSSFILFSACRDKKLAVENIQTKELWTCSMHPEIVRDKSGTCPICGMDLIKKVENATVLTDIMLKDLLQPTDEFVVSSIPVTTIKNKSEQIEIEALGMIAYDTRLVNTISARVSGRIEKLYVRYRYQQVMKGQRIMDIYSPELLRTEEELLFLIKNDPVNSSLINAAKQKLLLLGVSGSQLKQIIKSGKPSLSIAVYSNYSGLIQDAGTAVQMVNNEGQKMPARPVGGDISRITEELSVKEGMYVEKGQTIFQLYNINRSWALLNIFPGDQSHIKVGDAVRIVAETAPSKNFRAKIDFIEPFYRKENKTLTARVYFNNSQLQIPIGSPVRATIFAANKEADWLPSSAVLSLGIEKLVFIKTMGGFKAHKVETGIIHKNQIQILGGLNKKDSVAVNAQFLTDSESFIKINNQ